jgi:thermitase
LFLPILLHKLLTNTSLISMQQLEQHFMSYQFYKDWHADKRTEVLSWAIVSAFFMLSLNLVAFSNELSVAHEHLAAGVANAEAAHEKRASAPVVEQETDRIIVKYLRVAPGLSVAGERANLEKAQGLIRLSTITGIDAVVYRVGESDTASEVVERIKVQHGKIVEYAEVDMLVAPVMEPNDPSLGSAWHIEKVGARSAWDFSQGDGVTIAIADTGTDCSHPDLSASCVPGRNVVSNTSDTSDISGHGTKTAGTAMEIGGNAIGSAGIAYKSKVMPVRISDTTDGWAYFSDMADAVIYAADNGARVVNISYHGSCGSSAVISAATYLSSKGGRVVAAAGNTGVDELLSNNTSIVCVSATNSGDSRTSWSSFGQYVDVSAPGEGIYTTSVGGGYAAVSGTSFSSPLTAGIYALMFSVNPSLSPEQADNILFTTADDIGVVGWDMYYGYGRVNAARAVALAASTTGEGGVDTSAPTTPMNLVASNISATQVTLSWNPSSDNVLVSGYDVYRNGAKLATVSGSAYTNTGLTGDTTYVYAVVARDVAGNASAQSASVSVTTPSMSFGLTSASVSAKTATTAVVNISTNKPAMVMVKYGLSATGLTSTTSGPVAYATSQSVSLMGLKSKTKYFYQVVATSSTGEVVYGAVQNFRTGTR